MFSQVSSYSHTAHIIPFPLKPKFSFLDKIKHIFTKSLQPLFKSKKKLIVEKIDPKNYRTVEKTVEVWEALAEQKKHQQNQDIAERFTDCAQLCRIIAHRLKYSAFDEAYICKDKQGREQGVMLIDTDKHIHTQDPQYQGNFVKVEYLVTHPRNIRCEENEKDPERVEGTGSSLVQAAIRRADALAQDGVYLEGVLSAKPFYQKIGFREIPVTKIEDGYYTMVKTSSKIAKKIAPLFAAAA